MVPSSFSIDPEHRKTFRVTPVFRFMRPACEVYTDSERWASMSGSTWRRAGEIQAGGVSYRIDSTTMRQADDSVAATYRVKERFMSFTRVALVDEVTGREFQFHQQRLFSGLLVLSEAEVPVAEYLSKLFRSTYQVSAHAETPPPIMLLSIWLACVACVFNA